MRTTRAKGTGKIDLNLTSMLDVVFQLIVFFLLVTNFTTTELPELDPPQPDGYRIDGSQHARVVVNVLPDGPGTHIREIQTDYQRYEPDQLGAMTVALRRKLEEQPYLKVDLRADQGIDYREMHRVMHAINAAGVQHVRIVAREPDER
ncbi:MAG: hypothetical protein GC159_05685 [Phycisphaera sp.]|nr:hypothetical protein [Phycisphaera sp.]